MLAPGNILFTRDGRPLLADLGVARLRGQSDDAVRATPGYLDSAVAAGGVPGPHSDVFSLAAVAWRALTGKAVWESPTARESLVLAAGGVARPVRDEAPSTPAALAAAIDRALQRDTHLRGTAAELALDVRHAVQPMPVDGWTGRVTDRQSAEHVSVAPARASTGRHAAPADEADSVLLQPFADEPADGADWAAPIGSGPPSPTGGRPAFRRPEPVDIARVGSAAQTRAVRPRVAAAAPPSASSHRPHRRVLTGLACAALILAIAVAAGWIPRGAGAGDALTADATTADATTSQLAPSTDPSSSATEGRGTDSAAGTGGANGGGANGGDPDDRGVWERELARLDGIRQQAYAQRDAQLLAGIYIGQLLDADTAQLHALVPTGCGLSGAASLYTVASASSAEATPAFGRVVITASVTLAAGTLICGGAAQGTSAGLGPAAMQLVLVPGADGRWRVSEQRRL